MNRRILLGGGAAVMLAGAGAAWAGLRGVGSMEDYEAAAEVTLTLDGDGRIAGVFAPDRGALIDGVTVPTPWRGTFAEYRLHDGVWLPFFGEMAWEMPSGTFTYWQGRIETWERSLHD